MSEQTTSIVFGVDRSTRMTLGIIIGPIVLLCVWGAVDGAFFSGLVGAAAFGGMGLWYTTLKIEISQSQVVARRLGRSVWSADRSRLQAHFGQGGETNTYTALILDSPDNRKSFDVLKVQFGVKQLSAMAKLLGVNQEVPRGIF